MLSSDPTYLTTLPPPLRRLPPPLSPPLSPPLPPPPPSPLPLQDVPTSKAINRGHGNWVDMLFTGEMESTLTPTEEGAKSEVVRKVWNINQSINQLIHQAVKQSDTCLLSLAVLTQ